MLEEDVLKNEENILFREGKEKETVVLPRFYFKSKIPCEKMHEV